MLGYRMSHLNSFILTIYTASATTLLFAIAEPMGMSVFALLAALVAVAMLGSVVEESVQRIVSDRNVREMAAITGVFAGIGSIALTHGFAAMNRPNDSTAFLIFAAGIGFVWIGTIFLQMLLE
jgi:uncharacterized membrane protein YfcA